MLWFYGTNLLRIIFIEVSMTVETYFLQFLYSVYRFYVYTLWNLLCDIKNRIALLLFYCTDPVIPSMYNKTKTISWQRGGLTRGASHSTLTCQNVPACQNGPPSLISQSLKGESLSWRQTTHEMLIWDFLLHPPPPPPHTRLSQWILITVIFSPP